MSEHRSRDDNDDEMMLMTIGMANDGDESDDDVHCARTVSPKRVLMLRATGVRFGFWGVGERRQSEN